MNSGKILATGVALFVASSLVGCADRVSTTQHANATNSGKVHAAKANSCKGRNSCKGKSSCKGKNGCKNNNKCSSNS